MRQKAEGKRSYVTCTSGSIVVFAEGFLRKHTCRKRCSIQLRRGLRLLGPGVAATAVPLACKMGEEHKVCPC